MDLRKDYSMLYLLCTLYTSSGTPSTILSKKKAVEVRLSNAFYVVPSVYEKYSRRKWLSPVEFLRDLFPLFFHAIGLTLCTKESVIWCLHSHRFADRSF